MKRHEKSIYDDAYMSILQQTGIYAYCNAGGLIPDWYYTISVYYIDILRMGSRCHFV